MKYNSILKKITFVFTILSLCSLVLFSENGFAQNDNGMPLFVDFKFNMFESTFKQGNFQNATSIDLDLPSSTWNIKDIEINFTGIKFDTEIKVIENNQTNKVTIDKKNHAYGIQIKILDETIIYGVEIYGQNRSTLPGQVYIQVNGYNNQTNSPNDDIYGMPVPLNMPYSETPAWHTQLFSFPISLQPGNYYLIFNGILIGLSPQPKYDWYFNDYNPLYPELYSSHYNSDSWYEGTQGAPFLYSLIQKVNASIYPENINMTAQIDGNAYNILNGESYGKGYLKKADLNYRPNTNKVNVQVKNNKTSGLIFNASYSFNIDNNFKAPGQLKAQYGQKNEWNLTPEIIRESDNHIVRFQYPNSWYNINIFKNKQNITSDIVFNPINHVILIPNELIQDGAQWEIKANSPNAVFSLKTPKLEFKTGQELQFSIGTPILDGNYTFKLYDPLEREIFNVTKELPLQDNIFKYLIPANSIEGSYLAYVLWNNKTDAGVQIVTFEIVAPPNNGVMDLSFLIIIGIVLTGGLVIGGSSYVSIKKIESKKRDNIKLILEKCTEIMSLKHIIVLDNKSGIDIYSQSFEDEELDPTLISGFLQAIHNFGTEVLEKSKDTRTVKVEYKNSFILMTEFVNLRLIIIMGKNPSKNFLYSVESLAYYIYKYYGKLIDNFNGVLAPFQGISKLVEKILNVSFISPLKIVLYKTVKLNQEEKEMINKAKKFMREHDFEYFYSLYLLPDNACSPKDYETILKLIEKGIFLPIEKIKD
ncbi:MAG: hypothetical protein ACFFDF_02150 [Candidatus Odinarchaeota archaeon]